MSITGSQQILYATERLLILSLVPFAAAIIAFQIRRSKRKHSFLVSAIIFLLVFLIEIFMLVIL